MAFGKNPSVAANIAAFRAETKKYQEERQKRPASGESSGGRLPVFIDEVKIPVAKTEFVRPIVLRLQPVVFTVKVYDPDTQTVNEKKLMFLPYTSHGDGAQNGKAIICSGGVYQNVRGKREPCEGCDVFWAQDFSDKSVSKRYSKRDMYAFPVMAIGPHVAQESERTDKHGKPYKNIVAIEPFEATKLANEGATIIPAKSMHMGLGKGHFDSLMAYDTTVKKHCVACKTYSSISTEAWTCTSCQLPIITDDTPLSAEEKAKIVANPVICSKCHHRGELQELISCENCGYNAVRATLFDGNLHMVRRPTSTNVTILEVVKFDGLGEVPDHLSEIYTKPLNIEKIYAPHTLEQQRKIWGSYARNYGA